MSLSCTHEEKDCHKVCLDFFGKEDAKSHLCAVGAAVCYRMKCGALASVLLKQ